MISGPTFQKVSLPIRVRPEVVYSRRRVSLQKRFVPYSSNSILGILLASTLLLKRRKQLFFCLPPR